ncbi:MAG: hypothetical protein N3A55_10600 [Methylohalobius sp.]|nr:hypothetical protein [Methylohalobius sp.]
MATRYRRFWDISTSEKLLDTLFLLAIGLGYLFALTHLYFTHAGRDGRPGLSVQDVIIAYYGSLDQTRLEAAIHGIMAEYVGSLENKNAIIRWIHSGRSREQYEREIKPILEQNCVGCHNPAVNPTLPNLTTYEGVMEVASGKPASLANLVKVSHIHLFGIAFILYLVGRIFILCEMNAVLKRIIVIVPFAAMLVDILSWIPARNHPFFAYVIVASGGLMGLSMGIQIFYSLYQMWFFPYHPNLNFATDEQARIQEIQKWLHELGYELFPESGGWLVRENPPAWRFLRTLAELESYLAEVKARHLGD